MPRPLDPDARRARVAEAVWRVVATRGLAAASVRNVAAEAGLSAGAMRHVLPTQADLHRTALEGLRRRFAARLQALPPQPEPQAALVTAALATMPLDADTRDENRVYFALLAQAAADPTLRDAADAIRAEGEAWCRSQVDALAACGALAPEIDRAQAAAELHALADGLALHATMWPADADAARVEATLRRWLAAVAPEGRR